MTAYVRISRTPSRDGNISQARVDGGPWPFGRRVLAWPCADDDAAERFARILAGDLDASPARARFAAPVPGEQHPDDPEPDELCRRCGENPAMEKDSRCWPCKKAEQRAAMIARGIDPDVNRRALAGRIRHEAALLAARTRTEKPCRVCHVVKPLADFAPDSRALDKTKGTCRACVAAQKLTAYVGTPRPVRTAAPRKAPTHAERTAERKARAAGASQLRMWA